MTKVVVSLRRMEQQIRVWDAGRDRRSIFLTCYSLMTRNMLSALDQKRFHDTPWVRRWVTFFADFYFAALEGYEKKAPNLPLPWKIAFDAARDPNTYILQNLFLGVNAHINYDLIISLSNMLDKEWRTLPPAMRQQRYADFLLVNEVIGGTMDLAEDTLLKPFIPFYGLADTLLGNFNEWMTLRFISRWRDRVWNLSVRYLETPDPIKRQALVQYFEQSAAEQARAFLLSDLTDHFTDMK